jgi:SAM-dependent methyltransferase
MAIQIIRVPEIDGDFRGNTCLIYEQESTKYGATPRGVLTKPEFHVSRLKRVEQLMQGHMAPRSTLLDVGCGYGALIPVLPPGVFYVGVDPIQVLLDAARKNYPDFQFRRGKLNTMTIPLSGPTSDYVVAIGLAQHLLPGHMAQFASLLAGHARKGVIFDFQSKEHGYFGAFTAHTLDEVTEAFCQKPRAEDVLSDETGDDTTLTVFLRTQ